MTGLLFWVATLLATPTSHAAEASVGVQQVWNDPFLSMTGLVVTGRHHLSDALSVGIHASFSPDLGTGNWTQLTTQLVEETSISPDISKQGLAVAVPVGFDLLRTRAGDLDAVTRAYAGFGAVRTKDDLEALQAVGDERAMSTEFQTHPTTVFGLESDLFWSPDSGVRLRLHSMKYIETVNATTLEMKNNALVGLEYVARFGARSHRDRDDETGGQP